MRLMNNKPELKTIIKPLAWFIVITGWLIYGAAMMSLFLHPSKEDPIDTIQNFKANLQLIRKDWAFSIVMFTGIVIYCFAWAYIKGERKEKKQQNETNK